MNERSFGYFFLILSLFLPLVCNAQYTYTGKVTDSETGEPLPFVNVYLKNLTTEGSTTDFNGNYGFKSSTLNDTLIASYIGYKKKKKAIRSSQNNYTIRINFILKQEVEMLNEVLIKPDKKYEDPAFVIMRKVMANKKKYNVSKLKAYECEIYSKTELSIKSIENSSFLKGKLFKNLGEVLKSMDSIKNQEGEAIFPVFISESLIDHYYKKPNLSKDKINKNAIQGISFLNESVISQLMNSVFQNYNFYDNWIPIAGKEFMSPLADGWKTYYDYVLKDTMEIKGKSYYFIQFWSKNVKNLAFDGKLWISVDDYSLKQIDARINKDVNLNFVNKLKIFQELVPTDAEAHVVGKSRVSVDFGNRDRDNPSFVSTFYQSSKNYTVNEPHEDNFYLNLLEVDQQAYVDNKEDFWEEHRHEKFTKYEQKIRASIEDIKNVPTIKRFSKRIDFLISEYWRTGGIFDIGPYTKFISNNNVENFRVGFGVRTNKKFSENMQIKAYLGYGLGDEKLKYDVNIEHLLNRKLWTKIGVSTEYTVNEVSRINFDFGIDGSRLTTGLFLLTRNGNFEKPFYTNKRALYFQTDIRRGWTQRVVFKHKYFIPTFNLDYRPVNSENQVQKIASITLSELTFTSRFSIGEVFIQNGMRRSSIGTNTFNSFPIITLSYTRGINGLLDGEYHYDKLRLEIFKKMKLGILGTSRIKLSGGVVFGDLPYPLLVTHQGNESFFGNKWFYNLMNNFEFISDRYVELRYEHNFEGLLLNRIPLIKKANLRSLFLFNLVHGFLTDKNIQSNILDQQNPAFYTLKGIPYMEMGYGVQNVLKIIRIEFYHRLSHMENPQINKFGIKFRFQLSL